VEGVDWDRRRERAEVVSFGREVGVVDGRRAGRWGGSREEKVEVDEEGFRLRSRAGRGTVGGGRGGVVWSDRMSFGCLEASAVISYSLAKLAYGD